jgi:amidase
VAAGLVDFALGTDTSGSIRVPASYCGVYGFRPTHGLIPTDGVVPLAPSFDTVGWLARDARMLARCGRVLLGVPPGEPGGDAAGFARLGLLADAFEVVDERYRGALRDAVASMRGAFAEMREVHLGAGGLTAWFDAFHALKQWEAWQAHGAWIRSTSPRMADGIRANFEIASGVTAASARRPSASASGSAACSALTWRRVARSACPRPGPSPRSSAHRPGSSPPIAGRIWRWARCRRSSAPRR